VKDKRKSHGPWKAIISTIIFAISASLAVLLLASAAVAGVRWTANGVAVSATGGTMPKVASDDAGGAIVAWIGTGSPYTLMVQRMDPNGNARWTTGGVLAANIAGPVLEFGIAPDASHGAYLVWIDRVGSGPVYDHIYGQHIDANGTLTWTPAPPAPLGSRYVWRKGQSRRRYRPTFP
jgi:hypothetical protein